MPVIIDITQDARYQQGVEEGVEKGKEKWKEVGKEEEKEETALKMFQNGLDFSLIENVTGLERSRLEEIARNISQP